MRRNDVIIWFGRIVGVAFLFAMAYDLATDGMMSREIRQAIVAVATFVFFSMCLWQIKIAKEYDGWPLVLPLTFRWVVAVSFLAIATFVGWTFVASLWPGIYSDWLSAVFWLGFVEGMIWFAARWVTVDDTHAAGPGETGSGMSNGGAP